MKNQTVFPGFEVQVEHSSERDESNDKVTGGLAKSPMKVGVPPIKCQGIKTKLVKFILSSINWNRQGRWIEPFLGSGVVVFNLAPKKALLSDTNVHIIKLYRSILTGEITSGSVREYLEMQGKLLFEKGESHYYHIRERFNCEFSSLDFLFLSRAAFNGVMRFNKKGQFNVPFCKKTERFRSAYVTKIVNQVEWITQVMKGKDWEFVAADWRSTLSQAKEDDFVYADPPYAGRHTDYYNSWTEQDANDLLRELRNLKCGFALSTWKQNKYRCNDYVANLPDDVVLKSFLHFYHVGSSRELRNEIEEALIIGKRSVKTGADPTYQK